MYRQTLTSAYTLTRKNRISMTIYHIIYKTIHKNGNYYYGRHSTDNLNDGYLGSGKWVKSIKNKKELTREIVEYADSIEKLKHLEEKYLDEHYGKPNCMNWSKGSHGFRKGDPATKEIPRRVQLKLVEEGKHHLLSGDVQRQQWKKYKELGINPITNIQNVTERANRLIKEGKHNFQNTSSREKVVLHQKTEKVCPHCGKNGKGSIMFRHHFEKCKFKSS